MICTTGNSGNRRSNCVLIQATGNASLCCLLLLILYEIQFGIAAFKPFLTYFSQWQRGGGLFLLQEAVADAAASIPTAFDMDVSETTGDEGNLVIYRKVPLGELRYVPSLMQELLQILGVVLQTLTEARITSLSKWKFWGGR